jgi:hypothetical protein
MKKLLIIVIIAAAVFGYTRMDNSWRYIGTHLPVIDSRPTPQAVLADYSRRAGITESTGIREKCRLLEDFIATLVTYNHEKVKDHRKWYETHNYWWQSAEETITSGKGVCADYAEAFFEPPQQGLWENEDGFVEEDVAPEEGRELPPGVNDPRKVSQSQLRPIRAGRPDTAAESAETPAQTAGQPAETVAAAPDNEEQPAETE